MDSAADTELEGPLGHPNGCLSGQMSLRVYREVNKNPIMALFTSSAGHRLAVFPDRRRHRWGHRQGLGAAVTGPQRPARPQLEHAIVAAPSSEPGPTPSSVIWGEPLACLCLCLLICEVG